MISLACVTLYVNPHMLGTKEAGKIGYDKN